MCGGRKSPAWAYAALDPIAVFHGEAELKGCSRRSRQSPSSSVLGARLAEVAGNSPLVEGAKKAVSAWCS
jgi:hypothetical protein